MNSSIKLIVIGDGAVGKTSLLITYATNRFPTDYTPTVFDCYAARHISNEKEYIVGLFDTGGGEDYDRLRPLSYPQTGIFVLCFSVVEPNSFENIRTKWAPELAHHLPSAPVLVVGTKVDLRNDATIIDALRDKHSAPIQHHQGVVMYKEIEAAGYVECSARTGYGVKAVFDEAVRLGANPPLRKVPQSPRSCVIT